ncbi:MAG: ribonucleotide-diphosphate reductase subunit beta, partial [Alphaproteobacteria bacterium]
FNKMKGMGQIVAWSARDETLHANSIIRLFRTFVREYPEAARDLEPRIREALTTIVAHEDAFIDLAFGLGPIEGLEADAVKRYIRYIGDIRMDQLGYAREFGIARNPLPWMDEMLNGLEHTNFFENRATEYSKAATRGSWEEAFA